MKLTAKNRHFAGPLILSILLIILFCVAINADNITYNEKLVMDHGDCLDQNASLDPDHRCDYEYKLPGIYPGDRLGWTMAFGQYNISPSTVVPGIIASAPMATGVSYPRLLSGSVFLYQYDNGVSPVQFRSTDSYHYWPHRIDHPGIEKTYLLKNRPIGNRMGWSVTWINKFNNDNYLDFAVGVPFMDSSVPDVNVEPDSGTPKYVNGGGVYIISGQSNTASLPQAITKIVSVGNPDINSPASSVKPESWFGLSMVYAEQYYGNVNIDPVLIVGAPGPQMAGLHSDPQNRADGYVAIYSLRTNPPTWVETITPTGIDLQGGQQFGYSVSVAWDSANSVGYVAIGAPYYDGDGIGENSGRLYVYQAGNPSTRYRVIEGPAANSNLGHASVFFCADPIYYIGSCPNAIAASAPMYDSEKGRVALIDFKASTPTPSYRSGERDGDRFGWSLANAGDQGVDTYDELLIGSPMFDISNNSSVRVPHSEMGRVYLYYSPSNYSNLNTLDGEDILDRFGWSVGAYDVTGDGKKEIFIGAAWADQYVPLGCGGYRGFSGSVYMYKECAFHPPCP